MNGRNFLSLPMIAIAGFLAVAMIVAGAGLVILAEQETYNDVLEGTNLTIEPGTWSEGDVYEEVTYDLGVRLQSSADYGNVNVFAEISKADINTTDLDVSYYNGMAWNSLVFTDNGDNLVTTFGPSGGFPLTAGYDETTPLEITYHVTGHYDIDLWVATV